MGSTVETTGTELVNWRLQENSPNLNKKRKHTEKKKINGASETYGTITKDPTFLSSEFWKERRKKMGLRGYMKKQWLKAPQIWPKIQIHKFKKQ